MVLTNIAVDEDSFTETDPTVPAWAKEPNKPTYTAEDVGARPNTWTPTPAEIGAAPAYTYGTDNIEAGTPSPHPTGTLHFVYEPAG